jgi:aspartate carbamoyltransferase regulatory subunit
MTKRDKKVVVVSALENGSVIDHIPAENLFQVIRILKLDTFKKPVYFGTNLQSTKYGKKGLLKVKDYYFKNQEVNKIALVAPTATIIEIEDFDVRKKYKVQTPKVVENFVKCFNPKCITNHQTVPTKFKVIEDGGELKLRCHYCEKTTTKDTMVFK